MNDHSSRTAELFGSWGSEAVSARVFGDSARVWEDAVGAIGWQRVGSAAVAIGSPLAPPERRDELRCRFGEGRRVVFFGRELADGEPVPPNAYVVGEQPWWDVAAWPTVVARSRTIRSQVRRAAHKGVQIRAYDALEPGTPLRLASERLVDDWLRTRHMAPMGFVAAVDPFAYPELRRYFIATREDAIVGFLVATRIPARSAWVLDHIVRTRVSPNGTAEALVDAAMRSFAEEGAREVTLGLAPLAGRVPPLLAFVRRVSRGLYDFAGLYEFKAKLRPTRWERVLVEHPGQSALLGTIRALRAFAAGSFVGFGVRSLLRCPPPVLRMMSLAVLPWIALLWHLRPLLPYPGQLPGWIAFDIAFAVGLFLLARRIQRRTTRRRLHVALIAAAALDAIASLSEHVAWNVPRHNRPIEWIVASASWLVPALVAALLWSGLGFREREISA